MSSYVRNIDTGSRAKNRGNDYLPSWAKNSNSIAKDDETFANATGINSGKEDHSKDNTNHLGLKKTGSMFQGGQNQKFKQRRGEHSLHGQVQKSTGLAPGTVAKSRGNFISSASSPDTVTRKKINSDLELITYANQETRGRTYELVNSGKKDVELTLSFDGSTGVTVKNSTNLSCTTIVPSKSTVCCGEILIGKGRASVKMALAVKTIVGTNKGSSVKNMNKRGGTTSSSNSGSRNKGNSNKGNPSNNTSGQPAVAIYAFQSKADDECSLNENDEVQLLGEESNGWILVLNMTTGDTGLVPLNHLEINAKPKASPGSINNMYQKKKRGSWVSNRHKVVQPKKNNANDWDNETTNASVTHNGKKGMLLGESDGISIVNFDDGTVGQIPVNELNRVGGGGDKVQKVITSTKKKRFVVEKQPSTATTTRKEYVTGRAIDGIRVDYRSGGKDGIIRKAKAKHPSEKGINQLRGPPPVPKKSWKQFGK
jgi:hypothetical protein